MSAAGIHGNLGLDKLVKPKTPKLIRTITSMESLAKMLKPVKTEALQAQQALLRLISQSNILVGHSLNDDLMVLEIKHSTM